ncbi:MAG TPA: TRAP transporter large permease [Clostridia bacterium]|nr:TRAP transporter large permease [Clostridia bacterium]
MISILFILFFILLLIGVPIAFVLIISTALYGIAFGNIDWLLIPQRVAYGVNSYVMLCMPFFILAGNLMAQGGITKRMVDVAQAFVGHIRGGLAFVDVIACMLFGTISGSAITGTTAIGTLLIPSMKEEGYGAGFSAGLTAVASTCCPVIPPSLAFVIYASAAKVSVADMFTAGVLPGILMGGSLMIVAYVYSRKNNYVRKEKTPWKFRYKAILRALPCLGIPIMIIGGITSGFFTPTEAAAMAVVYALILSIIYRTLNLKFLWRSLVDSAIDSGAIMLIVGGCYLFGWVISNERIAVHLTEALVSMDCSLFIKLLIINIVLLIVGMFMDSSPAILLVAPILAPAMVGLGIDPIQTGMIICINLVIGLSTPPVGVCLYAASNIAKVNFQETVRSAIPFLIATIIVLMLITYIPIITQIPFLILG